MKALLGFQGHSFALPPDYQQVLGSFTETKVLEFEPKSAFSLAPSPNADEWGLDTTFVDHKLVAHLTERFTEFNFCFLDGRLCVESTQPRWVGDLYTSVSFQFHFFSQRTRGESWTFSGPSSMFRKSGMRQSMCPDVTVVKTKELQQRLSAHRGTRLPADVQGMVCFQVATLKDDEEMVHRKCQQLVSCFCVTFVVGMFVRSGKVRTYAPNREWREQANPQFVDLNEVVPGLRFYLRALYKQGEGDDDQLALWPFPAPCSCGQAWHTMLPERVETGICDLISAGNGECAMEGVNLMLSDVNYKDLLGRTPMVTAARADRVDILSELHRQGGKLDFTDAMGVSPVLASLSASGSACRDWLATQGVDVSSPSVDDVFDSLGCLPRLRLLLAAGAPVVGFNKNGVSPLCLAIQLHSMEAVKLLVEAGAPIHSVTNKGSNALNVALATLPARGELGAHLVSFFLDAGIKPEAGDVMVAKMFGYDHMVNQVCA